MNISSVLYHLNSGHTIIDTRMPSGMYRFSARVITPEGEPLEGLKISRSTLSAAVRRGWLKKRRTPARDIEWVLTESGAAAARVAA